LLVACAPELAGVKVREEVPPRREEHEVVPVGGYQILAGEWRTQRVDEAMGTQDVVLLVSVEGDVVSAESPEQGVRLRCQISHRTCLGTWSDNAGRGRVVLTLDLDFRRFTGTYDGTREGRDVGRTGWTGVRR
jgi:hypothetical protein